MNTIVHVKLIEETCCACSMVFGMPADLADRARADSKVWFYCPAGHNQHYTEGREDKLRRQLAAARQQRDSAEARLTATADQLQAAERSAAARKGVVTRMRNRAAAGRCQACDQSFPDVASHMAEQHPFYADEAHE